MTLILDDFDKTNLLALLNYTAGVQFVRNLIIFDANQTDLGSFTWYVEPYATYFTLYVYVGSSQHIFSNYTNIRDLVTAIHDNASLRELGIDAELSFDKTLEGVEYSESIRLFCDDTTDYRTISCEVNEGLGFSFKGQSTRYEQTGAEFFRTYFTLLPEGDNSGILAKDLTSILKYGARIYSVENYDMVTLAAEKQAILQNKLDELAYPKARCFVDIPFDYGQPLELDEVEVRLSYQNQGQLRTFKEGGHFKAWENSGTYRTKTFYIVGIAHSKSGKSTRLRLMEQLS